MNLDGVSPALLLPAALQRAEAPYEEPPLRLQAGQAERAPVALRGRREASRPAEEVGPRRVEEVVGCKEIGRWYGALSELPAWKKALPS